MKKKNFEQGTALVEYALLIALVGVIGIPAVSSLGNSIVAKFDEVEQAVAQGCSDAPGMGTDDCAGSG
jgi:Flp pilus assembly pilin Flp